jgi:hypothetical protein
VKIVVFFSDQKINSKIQNFGHKAVFSWSLGEINFKEINENGKPLLFVLAELSGMETQSSME